MGVGMTLEGAEAPWENWIVSGCAVDTLGLGMLAEEAVSDLGSERFADWVTTMAGPCPPMDPVTIMGWLTPEVLALS